MQKTFQIRISGLVQGVGFRPFIHRLANLHRLSGFVQNTPQGVRIVISGEQENLDHFVENIQEKAPPAAKIISCNSEEVSYQKFDNFIIKTSTEGEKLNLALTPDFALCENCLEELQNPSNKRYQYPFISCVDCGPRWSVTQKFPFDRQHTTLGDFKMCPSCQKEYVDPDNRRFHSQTHTCPDCGFTLKLTLANQSEIDLSGTSLFKKAAELMDNGQIIAVKNTSGFLLCCRADSDEVVQQLRKRKQRPTKPLAVLFKNLEEAEKTFRFTTKEKSALLSAQRPIVLASLSKPTKPLAFTSIAPGLDQVGIMLPTSGILFLLAQACDFPLIATSGNIHGSPVIAQNHEAYKCLSEVADAFLVHNLPIAHPQDDSVIKFSHQNKQPVLMRRARGYAPNVQGLNNNSAQCVLALGADLKSSVVFSPNNYFYQSPYLGNLSSFEVFERFRQTVINFTNVFQQLPQVVLADKHPLYQSRRFGVEFSEKHHIPIHFIQHHKAHFAAVLGEYRLWDKKVLGVVFDGTGLGDDGHIWGGEFFDYDQGYIRRIHHLKYYDWLAGDKMAKEPRLSLMALSKDNVDFETGKKFTPDEFHFYKKLKQHNPLKTSSVGRLFDALASLLCLNDYNTYEGQGAMYLENCIQKSDKLNPRDYLSGQTDFFSGKYILQFACNDLNKGEKPGRIAANFIYTIARYILRFANLHGYQNIACSGGVFQNTVLIDYLKEGISEKKQLFLHHELPPNDENTAFGQMMYFLNVKDDTEITETHLPHCESFLSNESGRIL